MPSQKDQSYPGKAYEEMAQTVAGKGRYGDSMIMHVNPIEVAILDAQYPGMITKNPETGQPEAFLFLLPLLAAAGSGIAATAGVLGGIGSGIAALGAPLLGALGTGATALGGAVGSGLGALGSGRGALGGAAGSGIGSVAGAVGSGLKTIGSGIGSVFGGGGGAASAVPTATKGSVDLSALLGTAAPGSAQAPLMAAGASTASPVVTSGLSAASGLAPTAGVLSPAAGGGLSVGQVSNALQIAPELAAKATPEMLGEAAWMRAVDPLANVVPGADISQIASLNNPSGLMGEVVTSQGLHPGGASYTSGSVGGSPTIPSSGVGVPSASGDFLGTLGKGFTQVGKGIKGAGKSFIDMPLKDKLAVGLMGGAALDAIIKAAEDDKDPYPYESGYDGPASWSDRGDPVFPTSGRSSTSEWNYFPNKVG